MKTISVVIPLYNENENIPVVYQALKDVFSSLLKTYNYEILFVDDGSTDDSWNVILSISGLDSHVKALKFATNCGHQIAMTAGYDYAKGDIVLSLDCDLQHPPSIIIDMLKKWEQGHKVVCARRITSQETTFKRLTSILYNKLFSFVSAKTFPKGISDFRLLDREVLDVLILCKERYRYLRGAIFLLGYPIAFVDYHQPLRAIGSTKYSLRKMFGLAFNGLICFSVFPLRIASYIGFIVLITGGIGIVLICLKMILYSQIFPLYIVAFLILYILLGMVFIMVWILGEYIARIYEINRNSPVYIVVNQAGIDKKRSFKGC